MEMNNIFKQIKEINLQKEDHTDDLLLKFEIINKCKDIEELNKRIKQYKEYNKIKNELKKADKNITLCLIKLKEVKK